MGTIFSFDLGSTSCGWCVLGLDGRGAPSSIIAAGVRIFSDGREPKSGTSLAEGRRMARGMARRRDRYKRRRKAVLRTLAEFGLMPDTDAARKALVAETNDRAADQVATHVYALRARALEEKLPLFHIGRALFHLNQRRGFKSNRKTDKRSNEKGAIELGIDQLRTRMAEAKAPTLGAFLAMRRAKGEWVRVRSGATTPGDQQEPDASRGNKTIYDFYPERRLLEEEFDAIWETQRPHYPEILTEERRRHLHRVMFFQRPLKPQTPGKCSFNPNEERLPKAHPLFQAFRLHKEVNELELVQPDQTHRKLDIEQRDRLIGQLRTQRSATYASLRKTLKLPGAKVRFNKESESRLKMAGDEVAAALADKACFGQRWFALPLDVQWAVVRQLREEEDPDVLIDWLMTEHGLTRDAARATANAALPDGYGRLGETALRTMLGYMQEAVIPEADAARLAGYDHALARVGEGYDLLPKYQEILDRRIPPGSGNPNDPYDVEMGRITNPTVHIGLNQLQLLVNGLIRRFGKPDRIAIELARDLNQSDEQKKKINQDIAKNTRDAEKRSQKLRDIGQRDNGHNRMLLKLWEELNPDKPEDRCCIYTGRPINIKMLFSNAVDIDHILPWSLTLDDGQTNRILCLREANRQKGNKAPADVADWQSRYDEILERANRLPEPKRWRFARDAMAQFEKKRDFLDRQLTDTQYLARLAHDYLGALYDDEEPDADGELFRRNHVIVVTGRMTEMLRRAWHLNDILNDHNYGETAKGKNRKDHRHHAIDAAVIGVTTRSMLQKIARAAGEGEEVGSEDALRKIPVPWDGFREELRDRIGAVVVSHKPDHGTLPGPAGARGQTAGRLHMDTAYGITREIDAKGNTVVVRRKMLTTLTEKDVDSIRDEELKARIFAATDGKTGKDFTAALVAFARNDRKFAGIRRVRVTEGLAVIPIRPRDDLEGKPYKGYKGGANYRYDVWELKNGKWEVEVVSMFDAHQRNWQSPFLAAKAPDGKQLNHNARKVMSLQQNDMVAYELTQGQRIIARVRKFGQNKQIWFDAHNEAGKLDERHNDKADPFRDFSKLPGGLKDIKLRQIRVDETGRVFDPGPQDRESRKARKAAIRGSA